MQKARFFSHITSNPISQENVTFFMRWQFCMNLNCTKKKEWFLDKSKHKGPPLTSPLNITATGMKADHTKMYDCESKLAANSPKRKIIRNSHEIVLQCLILHLKHVFTGKLENDTAEHWKTWSCIMLTTTMSLNRRNKCEDVTHSHTNAFTRLGMLPCCCQLGLYNGKM